MLLESSLARFWIIHIRIYMWWTFTNYSHLNFVVVVVVIFNNFMPESTAANNSSNIIVDSSFWNKTKERSYKNQLLLTFKNSSFGNTFGILNPYWNWESKWILSENRWQQLYAWLGHCDWEKGNFYLYFVEEKIKSWSASRVIAKYTKQP